MKIRLFGVRYKCLVPFGMLGISLHWLSSVETLMCPSLPAVTQGPQSLAADQSVQVVCLRWPFRPSTFSKLVGGEVVPPTPPLPPNS